MRHGALPPNPERRFVGQQDIALSEKGRAQAASWRSRLCRIPFAAVVGSDLSRCLDTAELATDTRLTPLIREPAFREIRLGEWEGLTPGEVEACFPGAYAERKKDMAGFRPAGGESFRDLAARVLPAFDAHVRAFRGRPLLIVAHAGVNRVILARAMALPLSDLQDIPQPYACCTLCPPLVRAPGKTARGKGGPEAVYNGSERGYVDGATTFPRAK
jgi:probable phosphoglycerate mutase